MKLTARESAAAPPEVTGEFVDLAGGRFYKIGHYDKMDPFFMSVVSDADHWMFLSSAGGLTAGRRDPDNALFPYYTDDRIHDATETTAPVTIVRVERDGETHLWEPFSIRHEGLHRVERAFYKSVYGNQVVFEETNHDLALTFRYSWSNSDRYGFVRRSTLVNHGDAAVTVDLLDGIRNVLPAGTTRRFQLEYSTLVDGYKRTEIAEDTSMALFRLSSIPVDNAEPSEALRVNVAWSTGLEGARVLLSTVQLDAFRGGADVEAETDIRGRRGAYILADTLTVAPAAERTWMIVAEVELDASRVRALMAEVATEGIDERVAADIERGTENLIGVVGKADGLQATSDEASVVRHFANTLFNVMRGGFPEQGYLISRDDVRAYLSKTNAPVAQRHADLLASLPEQFMRADLMEAVIATGDADLERLAAEYLPLSFSRRHGDPSRPWNAFAIKLRDEHGNPMLNYQGNWRDIFQNWEALALSYPDFVESMVFKFADSSTVDGYNPYRVLREGFEWEVVDPDDDWAFIGYWGDHQVIYLLRLLELAERYRPGSLTPLLSSKVFTFADVPYRIRGYEALLEDPRDTIEFDDAIDAAAMARAAEIGSDGKAVLGADGDLLRATLAEKLLLVALTKLSNFVPEGGIWLNTQRPEWNDANNALVGNGLSMVTTYYLRRYLTFLDAMLEQSGLATVEVSDALADLLAGIGAALEAHPAPVEGSVTDAERKALLDVLGAAGEAYRTAVYDPATRTGERAVDVDTVRAFIATALAHVDHTIAANRREDGLFHAYNIMQVTPDGIAVRYLTEMLEGQVAVLSAGYLSPAEVADVLDALRASAIYREDQNSYTLYPDRELPHFLEKNVLPAADVEGSALLTALLEAGDPRIVSRDVNGEVHFNAGFRNVGYLKKALDALAGSDFAELAAQDRAHVLATYERVFDHASFTGRSGTFYKYEGLGSIYWHMVSKLLLAVDEVLLEAIETGADESVVRRLEDHYEEIRAGIGAHKSPKEYGAVPTDPYSHTPGFAGVQQPGMTGQVKEDVISRLSEMGVVIEDAAIRFVPARVRATEFLTEPATLTYIDAAGERGSIALEPGTLGFTVCGVPVVLHRDGGASITVTRGDAATVIDGHVLDTEDAQSIFARLGEVTRLDVSL